MRHKPRHAGYEFRLRLEGGQVTLAHRSAGCRRFLYNLGLDQIVSERERSDPRRITAEGQMLELKHLKATPETAWLAEVPHHVLVQALRDLHVAMGRFFEGTSDFPRHKKKGCGDSFRFPDPKQFWWNDHAIWLPKFGWVKWDKHRDVVGRPTSATVKLVAGQWYVVIQCELPEEAIAPAGSNVHPGTAIDLNALDTVVMSDGTVIRLPRVSEKEWAALAALQRRLARQAKGSVNRRKTKEKIARLYARWRRRRMDAIHKATTTLAKNHGLVIVENLRVRNMTASARGTVAEPGRNVRQKAGLNRTWLDVAPATILRVLGYKLVRWGGEMRAVDPAFTSQDCAECGHRHADNRKGDRFLCLSCGHADSAHVNAARNIHARGMAQAGPAEPRPKRARKRRGAKPRAAPPPAPRLPKAA